MTYKLIFILCALLGGAYSIILNIVKYRSADNPTPESVSDIYDNETYLKWKKYSAEHCRLDIISSSLSCVLTVALLATNAYSAFANIFPLTVFWQIFGVVALEAIIDAVIGTVIGYVKTMVIEQKYGFNRSSIKTFIFDRIRSVILGLVLAIALSELIYLVHDLTGNFMIIALAGALLAFTLISTFLFPFFSRIGNKFTPLEDGELKDKLMELLTKHGYKVRAIEVMDASRRTTKLNAYIAGFGKTKTIVLYDNLLTAMDNDEICAIFAHELGHGLHKHVLKSQFLNIGYLLILATAIWLTVISPVIYADFGFNTINYGMSYILAGTAIGLLQPAISLVLNAISRAHEYDADRQAVKEGYGEAMIRAFKKLAKDNFVHLAPSRINVVLEYSHPPISDRIDAVKKGMEKE
ncbi:MAG: M48 family metallopeptidase [Ruminococcaceae bacterium]|nr:M48 family metallopeptidase [Oscillospiraceae bacterium]